MCSIILLLIISMFGCATNVTNINYEGFFLGMSVNESIKTLHNIGLVEVKGTDDIASRQFKIVQSKDKGIPWANIKGKKSDDSIFVIGFIDNELVNAGVT